MIGLDCGTLPEQIESQIIKTHEGIRSLESGSIEEVATSALGKDFQILKP
jgi:hypothetical protein